MHDNIIAFAPSTKASRSKSPIEATSESHEAIVQFSASPKIQRRAPKVMESDLLDKQVKARRNAWRKASAATALWDARVQLIHAAIHAQDCGVAEVVEFYGEKKKVEWSDPQRRACIDGYNHALGMHLLTPARTMSDVQWKRRKRRRFSLKVPAELIDKAIADDLAWLQKYPPGQRRMRRRPMD